MEFPTMASSNSLRRLLFRFLGSAAIVSAGFFTLVIPTKSAKSFHTQQPVQIAKPQSVSIPGEILVRFRATSHISRDNIKQLKVTDGRDRKSVV